jgi:hypothetical protein
MSDLSKSEKKLARVAIDKGLHAELLEGLENFEAILKNWRAGKFETNIEAYHTLYSAVKDKDYAIQRRYDGLSGGRYLTTVAAIYKDGYINDEDIAGFQEVNKKYIKRRLEF